MIEAIIFDFDGVIVDSNRIKRGAYFKVFSSIKNSKDFVEESIKENPEKTRYGIIEDILKKLRKRGLMQFNDLKIEKKKYIKRYQELTEEETSNAEGIKGAKRALEQLSQKYPLFILTSTAQESINGVVDARNLRGYFKAVYGAEDKDYNKPETLKKMARRHKFNPKNAVFIGDGKSDYECAKQLNVTFIGIVNDANDFETKKDIAWKLYNLDKLPEIIENIEGNL